MNPTRDPDTTLAAFLDEGPTVLPDVTRRAILTALPTTNQARRGPLAPWRFPFMTAFTRYAGIALVAIMALTGAVYLIGQRPSSGVPATPTASPAAASASPVAAATPVDTSTWVKYTSKIYGFSVSHPVTWSEQPATARWLYATQADGTVETLWSPSGWPDVEGFETKIPAGMTADTFLQALILGGVQTACGLQLQYWSEVTVDGRPGRMGIGGCNEHFYFANAAVVIGQRVWFFTLFGPDRSLLVPFLATVKIDPAAATD